MKNVFDDIAELVAKYGNLYESAVAAGDPVVAELYRTTALDLCGVVLKWGKK